ncbi:MAG: 4-(cytidine 5'-diphospho)-2-C-methyl-D-erythritol kinase [Alphaproteobacteria bacterium]
MNTLPKTISVFAPAKINMFLHITGKKSNGYHILDSLVCFADIGDKITIQEADSFSFHVTGEFSDAFSKQHKAPNIDCENLVVKAARRLAQITEKPLNMRITLEKNLPLAAGLGGGSSDAASTLWGLQEFWRISRQEEYLLPLMTNLGADVPVCLHCAPSIMRGIGDELSPAPDLPEIPILLVNPMMNCPTQNVFLHYTPQFKTNTQWPSTFRTSLDFVTALKDTENDLYDAALQAVPEIENIIHTINVQKDCLISRMSGSGASCFGLFETIESAKKAKEVILQDNPDWWAQTGWLNRPERY